MRHRFLASFFVALLPAIWVAACGDENVAAVPADAGRPSESIEASPTSDGRPSTSVEDSSDDRSPPVDAGSPADASVCRDAVDGGPRVAKPTVRQTGCCAAPFELLTETPGASIHYTLDGTCPSAASTPYTKPVLVCGGPRLMAIALKDGLAPSEIFDQTFYGFDCGPEQVPAPTFAPDAGTYGGPQDIALSCAKDGGVIFYTLDGTQPIVTSTQYTKPIHIEATTTISAIAAFPSFTNSEVAKATYTITDAGP